MNDILDAEQKWRWSATYLRARQLDVAGTTAQLPRGADVDLGGLIVRPSGIETGTAKENSTPATFPVPQFHRD